jgi:hypothetical protein
LFLLDAAAFWILLAACAFSTRGLAFLSAAGVVLAADATAGITEEQQQQQQKVLKSIGSQ